MKTMSLRRKRNQSGNAMIYILIAIALFAALIFTLTRGGRGNATLDAEKAAIAAHAITSFADKLEGAVNNVMLQNGCLTSQVSFENSTVAGYTNGAATAKCKIFDRAGGGLLYQAPPSEAIDTAAAAASSFPAGGLAGQFVFAGNVCVDKIGSGVFGTCAGDGVSNEDLLVIVPFIKLEVCEAINRELGNKGAISQDAAGSFDDTLFTGTMADGFALGKAATTFYTAGCYNSPAAATPDAGYHFYHVLAAR